MLEASQEAEGEWTDNKTVWVKNVQAEEGGGLKALRDQINALASAMTNTSKPVDKVKGEPKSKLKKDNGKNVSKSKRA